MSFDKVLSQEEIDALVGKAPQATVTQPAAGATPASSPAASSAPAKTEFDTLPGRLARMESEYATVKQELQAVLLDLREKLLETENPFNQPNLK